MRNGHWVKEYPAEIVICDTGGIILEMNNQAELLFAAEGGCDLLGTNLLDCHPQPALGKLEVMLDRQISNSYFNTENGKKDFIFQSPWYIDGQYAGFVEISFRVPDEIPHFVRK